MGSWNRRNFLRTAGGAAIALGAGLGIAGCSRVSLSDEPNGGTLLERLRQSGTVRVGFANEAPYSYIDDNADITGEAAELAKIVFRRLGVPNIQPIPSEFGSLIAGLKVGLFDVVGAGMAILPERCAEVLFTNPEFAAPAAFLVPKGNPKGIQSFGDVANEDGFRLGTLIGAVERDYAISSGVPEGAITELANQPSGLEAVRTGRIDGFALTTISLRDVLSKNPGANLEITKPFTPVVNGQPQYTAGGFAFLPDQQNIVDSFNTELAKMKENGELLEALRPFGFTEAEMTELTANELCRAPAS
ncbi:amino acid ABC transporter substrate-binding protein (PAAT family) [Tamaricihabitans halophyticus]|uniref:Amino acid ABC transporter substrate-binding protein (PAAT family) n=1 Tax=Tamaricihabitans halophyticus TaxID=1262583 RepID=A0A4R2R079_9PSEU|nr:ectoine/hydroxyectoine ABC transporter substrate-binding protein EhuB [Tamaricihabitans halophyticus]TCP54828.1 amino acid ABC transporter substrate-binding protein (PAAT family) [Tamaricihabitans halophyticus]